MLVRAAVKTELQNSSKINDASKLEGQDDLKNTTKVLEMFEPSFE